MPAPIIRLADEDVLGFQICKKLSSFYGVSLSGASTQSTESSGSKRPLLILLYRSADLHTMLYHAWSYLTLIQEIFTIKNNSFQFEEALDAPKKTYDIDFKEDAILNENAFRGFHEAGENVDKSLNAWKREYEQINRKTAAGVGDISSALTTAMDALPAMTE